MKRIRQSSVVAWFTLFSFLLSFCGSAMFASGVQAQSGQKSRSSQKAKFPVLSLYATDLTEMARLGKYDSNSDHQADVNRAIQILSRDSKNNPVLTGDSTADSNSVAEALAKRIATGDVPAELKGKRLFSLNLDALFGGLESTVAFGSRLQLLLNEVAQAKGEVVLFAPELQQFVGQRASQYSSNALATALGRGDLQLLGATSSAAFAQYIQSDDTVRDLFVQVRFDDRRTENAKSEIGKNANDYVGEKVSPDLAATLRDSSNTDRIKVILQVADIQSGRLATLLNRYGVQIDGRMSQLGTIVVELPVSAIGDLAASNETRYMSLDAGMMTLGHVERTTGADAMRELSGNNNLEGENIGIAIIDSGLFKDHDLVDKVKFQKDFVGDGYGTEDLFGHGTHVAGLMASKDAMNGTFVGIAPKAEIVNLRVLDKDGRGSVSQLLAALDWVMLNRTTFKIKVVNMSLGTLAVSSYINDPLCRAVRRLVDAGIVVVAAAGNNGKDADGNKVYGHIHSPGNEPSAITVGATNSMGTDVRSDDNVASFSSRGPTRSYWTDEEGVKHYDNLLKPDLVAPGNKLIAAESMVKLGSEYLRNALVASNPQLHIASGETDPKKQFMTLSGTSMAAPIVAGAAALLVQANPKLTPNMVKMILMYTAQPINGANQLEQGAGQLNIAGAVTLAKRVRTDITSSTPVNTPLLTSATPPMPQSTIAGQTFTWGQGIILNYTFATGIELITMYQGAYRSGVLLSDGVVLSDAGMGRNGVLLSDGIMLSDNILRSDGVLLSDGVAFLPCGVLLSDGLTFGDGILLSDGILVSDGVLLSDGILLSDSVTEAMSSMLNGDDTPSMTVVP